MKNDSSIRFLKNIFISIGIGNSIGNWPYIGSIGIGEYLDIGTGGSFDIGAALARMFS